MCVCVCVVWCGVCVCVCVHVYVLMCMFVCEDGGQKDEKIKSRKAELIMTAADDSGMTPLHLAALRWVNMSTLSKYAGDFNHFFCSNDNMRR